MSVCLSVQTITFEKLHIGSSFLVWRYILTISRSSLSIKVIGSRSRSCAKNDYLLISTCYSCVCYRLSIRSRSHTKVKVTKRVQGQIKVKVISRRDAVMRVVCSGPSEVIFMLLAIAKQLICAICILSERHIQNCSRPRLHDIIFLL